MEKSQTLAEFLGLDLPKAEASPLLSEPLSIEAFCRGILESEDYRRSILRRVQLDELPSAIEAKLYDYAYGKPVEKVEHSGTIDTVTEVRQVIVHEPLASEDEPLAVKKRYDTH